MQSKITLLLIFLGVLPATILGLLTDRNQEELFRKNLQIYEGFAGYIRGEISRRIWAYRKLLSSTAQLLTLDRMSPSDCQDALGRVLTQDQTQEKGLESLAIYDRSKQLVAQVGPPIPVGDTTHMFADAVLDTYGGSTSPQPRSTDTPAPFGPVGLLGLSVGPLQEQKPSSSQMQLKFAVYGPSQEIRGALIANIQSDYLSRCLNQILSELAQISQKVDIYVLDADQRCIAATQTARYRDQTRIHTWELARRDPEMEGRLEVPLKSFYTPDWKVVVVTRSAALEPLRRSRTMYQRVILAGIMAAIVLGLVFTRTITEPLSRLVHSALAISQGDLSRPVEVHSSDEIGDLAQTFEMMRINLARMHVSLRDKINELSTLYQVGNAISSTLNFNELLNLILDQAMNLRKADKGSIMLVDEETQELRIAVAKGLSPDVVENARVKIGESISGYVLETGRPMLIPDPSKSPNFLRLKAKDRQIHDGSLIAVPLIAKDKKLGVLNVSKSSPNALGEKDLEFFKALSAQAAIAIENARLYELAIKDELTKLFIRRYFDQRLKEEVRRARRYRSSVTVMLLDIDHFKMFNDTYGHSQGDEVLGFLSRIMRDCVRDVDIVARYGGEEFAIICPDQSLKEAAAPAERIRKSVETTPLTLSGKPVKCTVSIGIATYPRDTQRLEELVDKADQALYHAKHTGRNRVCAFKDVPPATETGEPKT